MRKLLYLVATAGLVGATAVALATASRTAPSKASATPTQEAANAYLPAGMAPAADNWNASGGDVADTGFSQLKQITSSNVGSLKVAWNGSYGAPAAGGSIQQAPICCPDGLMYVPLISGMVAINPGDGTVAWEYKGAQYNLTRGANTQLSRPARTVSYSPKSDYIYQGQQDGSVVALKAKTGAPVWTDQVSGAGTYGAATSAISPMFTQWYDDGADGILLAAPNGGESPFRGHVDAYNGKTGALIWRSWNTPDPTQLPYILTWSNPAEASQGGAAVWGLGPAVDTQLGLVYYGTGNLFPWTGRQPGDNLWGTALQAVDWKTGALRWYYQSLKHDIWDLDCPAPPSIQRVPIDGKMTPVVTEGCKSGVMLVLNAANGSYLPHFGFAKVQTYDPTGRGKKLNGLSQFQWLPQGAAGCVAPQDMTAAGLATCRALAEKSLVAASTKDGAGVTSTGVATLFPADYMQISYGGNAPKPGTPGSYGTNVVGMNGTDPCPTCKVINLANNKPIVGTTMAAAPTSDAYFAFGGTANGPYNYPHKAYSPLTHDMYACVRSAHSAKSDSGNFADGTESTNAATVNGATSDPRLFTATVQALNLTNNTFDWQYGSKVSTLGSCNAGTIATAGNLVLTGFAGRTDLTAVQLFGQGISPGGTLAAFDATNGSLLWQWGTPGATFASAPITYTYKGKQYIAVYHSMPTATALPNGAGHLASDQREQMTVFSL